MDLLQTNIIIFKVDCNSHYTCTALAPSLDLKKGFRKLMNTVCTLSTDLYSIEDLNIKINL